MSYNMRIGEEEVASPPEVQKAPEFHCILPPQLPCFSSFPALCFPSMKIVNLFYLFQSILSSVPLRAEAAMVTLLTHA